MSCRYVPVINHQLLNSSDSIHQCAIPAFEGLIPAPHDTLVRRLLFELATWHALAKLRRHSDPSTMDLEASTVRLGELLREFRDTTCEIYPTTDLPTQQSNRSRKKRKSTKKRKFSLTTYKLHSLGHYVRYIRRKGTTDSYSSQNVCHYSPHCFPLLKKHPERTRTRTAQESPIPCPQG
jgi:hypothetical protein